MRTTLSHSRAARAAGVRTILTTAVLMTGLLPAQASTAATDAEAPGKPITVMTRNVYLGADINRPVTAARAAEKYGPQAVLMALANATHETRAIVEETNFPARATLLADEIIDTKPQLVGLQEVALWRSGPLELDKVGEPNATHEDYDFLEILLDELADRGKKYLPVVIGERADVEAPSFPGNNIAAGEDIRLTMHDVILMDANAGAKLTGKDDEVFEHNLKIPVAGRIMEFTRGYQWVDVRAGGESFRFVNSHFEAFGAAIASAQAAELLAEAVPEDRTTIFVCDCNSDPDGAEEQAKPYDLLTTAFNDQWLAWAPTDPAFTFGLTERVRDTDAKRFKERIDMIFARTADGEPLEVDRGEVVGTTLGDRDPVTGLWPSDHGGVVLRLRGL